MIGEADRAASGEAGKMLAYIKSPEFSVAAFKGQKLTLRDWNLQLRQPILLFDGRNTVSVSPQEGLSASVLGTRHARLRSAGDQMQTQVISARRREASGGRQGRRRRPRTSGDAAKLANRKRPAPATVYHAYILYV